MSDCGGALMAKGYTLKNLTVSRKIEFFPEKRSEIRGEFSWRNRERELV